VYNHSGLLKAYHEYQPITPKNFYAHANVCEINEFLPLNRQNYQKVKGNYKNCRDGTEKIREYSSIITFLKPEK